MQKEIAGGVAGNGSKLVLLCGLPGAGKTTMARRLEEEGGFVLLCSDMSMAELGIDLRNGELRGLVEGDHWRVAQELLRQGRNVILDFGFWSRHEQDEKRLGARAAGAAGTAFIARETLER